MKGFIICDEFFADVEYDKFPEKQINYKPVSLYGITTNVVSNVSHSDFVFKTKKRLYLSLSKLSSIILASENDECIIILGAFFKDFSAEQMKDESINYIYTLNMDYFENYKGRQDNILYRIDNVREKAKLAKVKIRFTQNDDSKI